MILMCSRWFSRHEGKPWNIKFQEVNLCTEGRYDDRHPRVQRLSNKEEDFEPTHPLSIIMRMTDSR